MHRISVAKTLTYMTPNSFEDGYGFRTVVLLSNGKHFVISEVHRDRVDEVFVFSCTPTGQITDWTEVYGERESNTENALRAISSWSI